MKVGEGLCSFCYHCQTKDFKNLDKDVCAWHGIDIKKDSKAEDFNCEYWEVDRY